MAKTVAKKSGTGSKAGSKDSGKAVRKSKAKSVGNKKTGKTTARIVVKSPIKEAGKSTAKSRGGAKSVPIKNAKNAKTSKTAIKRTPAVKKQLKDQGAGKDRHERIRIKAYELFVQRGYALGHDMRDWFDAERLVEEEERTGKRHSV